MAQPVDAFLLYNEKEMLVEPINTWLELNGVVTHYFRDDVQIGDSIDEMPILSEARSVIVFLGSAGWGSTHLKLVQAASAMRKPLLPVLIGQPPEDAKDEVDGLFRARLYLELPSLDEEKLQRLIASVRRYSKGSDLAVNRLIQIIVDGNDEQRHAILAEIKGKSAADRRSYGERLRDEIGANYTAQSIRRAPHQAASIRSWMLSALAWCDADNPGSIELFNHHVDASEPEPTVRYWTLASVYQAGAKCAQELASVAITDRDEGISYLARSICSPNDELLVNELRAALQAEQFQRVLPVLRILRVVAVTSLVPDVCDQLYRIIESKSLTYDVLSALSNPEMAREAAPLLVRRMGVSKLIDIVVDSAVNENFTTIDHFANLLAAFDFSEVRQELKVHSEHPAHRNIANRLLQTIRDLMDVHPDIRLTIPGYTPDSIVNQEDQLGIGPEVETLAAIMLAKESTPPLAIGLFGDWGAGKSFFMRAMRESVSSLSERHAKRTNTKFCTNVVQIEFNAWHYADTNLWASLVTFILEELARHVFPALSPEEQQARLVAELLSAQTEARAAEDEKKRATEQLEKDEIALRKLRDERQEKEAKLQDIRATDIVELTKGDEQARKMVIDALDGIGLPSTLSNLESLQAAISDAFTLSGRTSVLFVSLIRRRGSWWYIFLMVGVLFAIPGFAYLVHHFLTHSDSVIISFTAVMAQIGAIALAVKTWLRKGLDAVSGSLEKVEAAKNKIDTLLAARKSSPQPNEIKIAKEVEALKVKEQEAVARLSEAATRVAALESRLKEVAKGTSLANFLMDRTQTDDYRKHLGLVSQVRRDFDALSKRLTTRNSLGDGEAVVDRIVLYIDDLDRCAAPKVVEVLQAVHLLLAYPLFVVVVGVDSRWLLGSLSSHYRQLGGNLTSDGDGVSEWSASPQHYLEKIFQIPFCIRPMNERGYRRLINQLMASGTAIRTSERGLTSELSLNERSVDRTPLAKHSENRFDANAGTRYPLIPGIAIADSGVSSYNSDSDAKFEIAEEALDIQSWEAEFASELHSLIPSPRAAKRLSNIYRILKAAVRASDLGEFEGTREIPGSFRVPMLLLAILICNEEEASLWFGEIVFDAKWHDEIESVLIGNRVANIGPRREALVAKVRPIVTSSLFPRDSRLLLRWIPQVARFSFTLSRTVVAE